jgi:hypothetical protein
MLKRRRFKHTVTLEHRLAEEARRLREQAEHVPPGPGRDKLLMKARQAETAAHLSGWLTSPGLQPPH